MLETLQRSPKIFYLPVQWKTQSLLPWSLQSIRPLTLTPWSSRFPQFPYHHFLLCFFPPSFLASPSWSIFLNPFNVTEPHSSMLHWLLSPHPYPWGTHTICDVILPPCSCWHLPDPCLHLWTRPRAPTWSHWTTQPQALESPNQFHYLQPSLKTRRLITKTLRLYSLSE